MSRRRKEAFAILEGFPTQGKESGMIEFGLWFLNLRVGGVKHAYQ